MQAITEQQRNSDNYGVARTVYTIFVITAPYKLSGRTHEVVRDEVLISTLNPRNLKGFERKLFNHELIYLNPNYRDAATPQNYWDWLDLIYESIHSPVSPEINIANEGIRRAAELIEQQNISPEEWEQAKIEVMKREMIVLEREEEKFEIAAKMKEMGIAITDITKATGLGVDEIERL